eukprot:CAMPEP_0175076144 /NCGR_PEP_ID=MMETSP0052_2-20121109/22527_1 /TAXON_ID=51329 ORGANISM="Polytomella parva, Strain SAG 63-3" /NCGR_SAMPLE_ID=MMETSP0052_2 /ASSEMBLY_ACC=CAM_ASM_000194 /LENGTH=419 /DNA_ID=CAMNT_0016345177 /DNA_START=111 /DNA_END=1366 /DNA_ORIENTATION=+
MDQSDIRTFSDAALLWRVILDVITKVPKCPTYNEVRRSPVCLADAVAITQNRDENKQKKEAAKKDLKVKGKLNASDQQQQQSMPGSVIGDVNDLSPFWLFSEDYFRKVTQEDFLGLLPVSLLAEDDEAFACPFIGREDFLFDNRDDAKSRFDDYNDASTKGKSQRQSSRSFCSQPFPPTSNSFDYLPPERTKRVDPELEESFSILEESFPLEISTFHKLSLCDDPPSSTSLNSSGSAPGSSDSGSLSRGSRRANRNIRGHSPSSRSSASLASSPATSTDLDPSFPGLNSRSGLASSLAGDLSSKTMSTHFVPVNEPHPQGEGALIEACGVDELKDMTSLLRDFDALEDQISTILGGSNEYDLVLRQAMDIDKGVGGKGIGGKGVGGREMGQLAVSKNGKEGREGTMDRRGASPFSSASA